MRHDSVCQRVTASRPPEGGLRFEALEWLPDALIYSANVSSILDSDAVLSEEDLPGRWQAAGVLAAYVKAFVSLAYGRFPTRDIT